MLDYLVVVAHPDDEVLYAGGLLAKAVQQGFLCGVLVLTDGRSGRTLGLVHQDELAKEREKESRASAKILGIHKYCILQFQDYDDQLNNYEGLKGIPEYLLKQEVQKYINLWSPKVLLTFPPNGINGHPDHVVTSHISR